MIATMDKGAAQAAPNFTDDDVECLALDLARGSIVLPRSAVVSKATRLFDKEARTMATAVTVGLLSWTPRELLTLNLVNGRHWNWAKYEALCNAVPERVDDWQRPHHEAAIPDGKPARW